MFSDTHGWEYSTVLGYATIAGFAAIIGQFFFGWVCTKRGPKFTYIVCLVGAGLSFGLWSLVQSEVLYVVLLTCTTVFASSFAYIAGGALVANWFPKKKGLAMGYATMGNNLSSAIFCPILSWMMGFVGMSGGMMVVGGVLIVMAILCALTIRETPEECGETPDNVPREELKNYFELAQGETYVSRFTTSKLLRTKETYLIALVLGINFMVTVGVMSQLVPRNVALGFSEDTAMGLMSVCAIIGIAGSYMWGWLDTKFGTKKAMIAFSIQYAVALVCNISEIRPLIYLSLLLIGSAIGGAANFTASLTCSVFGRQEFKQAYAVIYPLLNIIQQSNFWINALALKATGSLRGAYAVYAVILLIGGLIVSRLDDRKFNQDYAAEKNVETH